MKYSYVFALSLNAFGNALLELLLTTFLKKLLTTYLKTCIN